MIHFVGAGPGAADLITMRGHQLLTEADVIIYAGSLVNPELLQYAKASCSIYNSASMTLEEVIDVMKQAEEKNLSLEYTLYQVLALSLSIKETSMSILVLRP